VTWGWRDRLVAGAGALVLAASFLPWWTLRVRHGYGPPAQETFVTHDGNAWRMSTLWSVAVVLAVLAALVSPVARHVFARLALVGGTDVAIGLTVLQLRLVEALPRPGSVQTTVVSIGVLPDPDPDATTVRDWMARDHLRSYHDPGLYADVNWGLWVGLAAMVLVAVTIILAGRRHIAPVPG
jgi:uncharacterized membrane protein